MVEILEEKLSDEEGNENISLGDYTRKSVVGAVYKLACWKKTPHLSDEWISAVMPASFSQ